VSMRFFHPMKRNHLAQRKRASIPQPVLIRPQILLNIGKYQLPVSSHSRSSRRINANSGIHHPLRGLAAQFQSGGAHTFVSYPERILHGLTLLFLQGIAAHYSSRSVLAGSILATLRLGIIVARSVTTDSVSITARMVGASYTPTP
jgi:hypothetical protein